jgi:hypothetical protein
MLPGNGNSLPGLGTPPSSAATGGHRARKLVVRRVGPPALFQELHLLRVVLGLGEFSLVIKFLEFEQLVGCA